MVMAAMRTTVRGKVGATTRVRRSCGAGSGAAPQEFHPSVRARAGDRTPPRRSVTQETAPTRDAQIFWNCHL